MCPPTLGMDNALGNPFTVLMGQFFDQLPVLHKDWPTFAGGKAVLIVSNRSTGAGCQAWGGFILMVHCQSTF